MRLSQCVHNFFDQYLTNIRGVSHHTVKGYRDTFTIFLPFVAQYHSVKVSSLKIEHISPQVIIDFLEHLETKRNNIPRTRNNRLAALKSFAKMIRLTYTQHQKLADRIIGIPSKRALKRVVGFLTQEEMFKVLNSVDVSRNEGFRDYTILHLLFDSGFRASEIVSLKLDYLDYANNTLSVVGKGSKLRQVKLWPKTSSLLKSYTAQYRLKPKPLYQNILFITQRREDFTRHGINKLCKKYLSKVLSSKRLKTIDPVHCFRHSCAINMLQSGVSLTGIKNHLGHENIQSTMIYLQLNITSKRDVQKRFIEYTQSILKPDPNIEELFKDENSKDILTWLDSL